MKFCLSAAPADIKTVCLEIDKILKKWMLTENEVTDIVLSLDEALTNILLHGFSDMQYTNREIQVELFKNLLGVHVIITDNAKPYSMEKAGQGDIKSRIKNKVIGGLGVFIIKNLMTSVRLTRIKNQNILWMSKEIQGFKNFKPAEHHSTDTIDLKLESSIFTIQIKKGSKIEVEDAAKHIDLIRSIIESNSEKACYGILLNTIGVKNISREAQQYYSDNHLKNIKAMAIVVNSVLTRWIGGVISAMNRHNSKVIRIFNKETEAHQWINDILFPRVLPGSDLSRFKQKF